MAVNRSKRKDSILFLDIDGVLLSGEWLKKCRNPLCIEPIKVEMLNIICKYSECKVVVSSTWRRDEQCRERLIKAGFKGVFHADWRTTMEDVDPKTGLFIGLTRGNEIQKWLDNNPWKNYVIVDDDRDMLPSQKNRLVLTDFEQGLTSQHVGQIVTMFGT